MNVGELYSSEEYVQNEEGHDWVAQEATFFFFLIYVLWFFFKQLD